MDKVAANNYFTSTRKLVKKAKSMVAGNLVRKIAKLKQESEKGTTVPESKTQAVLDDIKLLKTLDSYQISKEALLDPDWKKWDKLISDSKATKHKILIARVISKTIVQNQVNKFREEHKDLDEWINEYIEFREKKKELVDKKQTIQKPAKYKPSKQKLSKQKLLGKKQEESEQDSS